MAGQRTITAQINRPDGSAWGGAVVRFKPTQDSFTQTPDASYPIDTITAVADSTGVLQVTLASGLSTTYLVTMPDDEPFTIIVEDGSDVSLEDLRAATEGAAIPAASIESIIAGFMASYVGQGIIVQEDDTTKVSVLGVLDFRTGLNVTESPTGEANVVVDVGTASTQVAAGDHLHDSRYYTESEVDALIAAIQSGSMVKLNASAFSAVTEVIVDNVFTATYRNYVVMLNVNDATSAGTLQLQLRTGGGSGTNVTAGYDSQGQGREAAGNITTNSANAAQGIITAGLFNGAVDIGARLDVFSPQLSARKTVVTAAVSGYQSTTNLQEQVNSIGQRTAAAHTGFRVFASAGNITGDVRTYGIVN